MLLVFIPRSAYLPMVMKPICGKRKIKADYRCTYASQTKYSFRTVQPQHPFDDGATTELLNISINLNDVRYARIWGR